MGLTISLNRVTFIPPPVRNNIFYEIETSSSGLYNTGLGAQSTGGACPRFGEKPLKIPIFAPSFEKVWIRPQSTLQKNIGPYIWAKLLKLTETVETHRDCWNSPRLLKVTETVETHRDCWKSLTTFFTYSFILYGNRTPKLTVGGCWLHG